MNERRTIHRSGGRVVQDFHLDFVRLAFDRDAEFHAFTSSYVDCETIESMCVLLPPSRTRCFD